MTEEIVAPEEIEQKAAAMGHMTQEEWTAKGRDPEKWRPASEFVERGENLMPILKERLKHQTNEIAEMKETMKQLHGHFLQAEQTAERRGWENAIAKVTAMQRTAAENTDVEEFDRLETEKYRLLNKPPEVKTVPEETPAFKTFKTKNEWYGDQDHEEATVYADGIGMRFKQKNPDATLKQVFEEVEKKVKTRFPEMFTNPRRDGASAVEGASPAPVKRGTKTFDDLPKEAKDAYARFAKQIPGYKKEDYLRNYAW